MNIYFYDNFSSSYNRFGNNVASRLIDIDENIKIFYIHDNYDNGLINLNRKLKRNIKVITAKQVENTILNYPPDGLLCFGFRIPDVYWTTFFNKINVHTYQVMHGLYIKKYNRNVKYLLKELPRILSYLKYLIKILLLSHNKTSVFVNLIKKDLGLVRKSKLIDEINLSKTLILWGEYWKEWYITNFGYSNNVDYEICGSFDFNLLKNKGNLIENNENSITYISQTLAEDGRINKRDFIVFLDCLFNFAKKCNKHLFIKLHPRSDINYYKIFKTLANVTITNKFPISDVYISHYSALLTVPFYLSKKIILVKFPNHPIPEEYIFMSPNIIDHDDKISIENIKFNESFDHNYYFQYVEDPFLKVAETILKNS